MAKVGNQRVSYEQRVEMLNFMKMHPELATNKISGTHSAVAKQSLWNQLAVILNDCPTGARKTPVKWTKVWQDWRCDTKKKAARIRAHANGKGGGSALKVSTLSSQEKDLMGVMEQVATAGNMQVPDPLETQLQLLKQQKSSTSCTPVLLHTVSSSDLIIEIPVTSLNSPPSLTPPITSSSPQPTMSPPTNALSPPVNVPLSSSHLNPNTPMMTSSIPPERMCAIVPPSPQKSGSKKRRRSAESSREKYLERIVKAAEVRAEASKESAAALASIAETMRRTSKVICETLREVSTEYFSFSRKEK